jgi:hypothetical protein
MKGLWVWPPDPRGQRRVLRVVSASPHLMAAIAALGKSKEGMSNAEISEAINDTAEWTTLWVVRQLTSLGFVDFKVDLFGNPARYQLTELGLTALSILTGKPAPQKQPTASPSAPSVAPQTVTTKST